MTALIIATKEMKNILEIDEYLEELALLNKDVTKKIEHEAK